MDRACFRLQLPHIYEALPSTLQLSLIIPLSSISRLALRSISHLTAPFLTPAVMVRGG